MVMKSYFAREKQQQKPQQQLHHPHHYHSPQLQKSEKNLARDYFNELDKKPDIFFQQCGSSEEEEKDVGYVHYSTAISKKYKFCDKVDLVINPTSNKALRRRSDRSKRRFYSSITTSISHLTFVLVVVISLLSDKLAHGANANPTLASDLRMNNRNGDSDESINSNSSGGNVVTVTVEPTSLPLTTTTTTTTGSSSSTTGTTTTTAAAASLTSTLPSTTAHVDISSDDNLNISYNDSNNKKTRSHLSSGGGGEENEHINFVTIPIPVSPDSAIVVKQGSIVYEVINNGTVSTNLGTFTMPLISRPGTGSSSSLLSPSSVPDARMKLFEKMTAEVLGLRVEETAKGVSYKDGASKILANSRAVIRFFGTGFTNNTIVRFVTEEGVRGTDCDDVTSTKYFQLNNDEVTKHSAVATVTIPPLNDGDRMYYVCVREDNTEMPWIHQGPEQWIMITTYQKWLPVWAHIALLVLLLVLSGLFSGLNLGLMAIDRTELKIIINAGSETERRHAKQIQPVRDNGNYLLCSLLLGNVLVNASLTILLDDLTSGLIAVIGSTIGIVIFGEIVPQAVCSRHGLAVGAKTVWITKFFMAATFPLSYPISVILNKVLGEELGNVYNRDRLKELIRVTQGANDLEKDEVNIISGALELKQKTVIDVMTRLEDVYMLPIDAVLDFDTVSEIMSNGYSRIPVYENLRGNVVSLLYAKDLAFVDPDDKMPLRTICEFYSNPCHFVFENVTLNVLFNVFKQGNKGHMAFVQRVKSNDKSDPMYEVIGLVTMEDVIEELIQDEITDETDVWDNNREADIKRRSREGSNYDAFFDIARPMPRLEVEGTTVSPQLTLAALQYMSTAVEEFEYPLISKSVLERLLKQNIYFHIKIKNKELSKKDPSTILFEMGKPADYFIMILEGRVQAEIGKENLVFESGPFSYFGTKSLLPSPVVAGDTTSLTPATIRKTSQSSFTESAIQPTFIPDYTVRAVSDLTYFQISRPMYLAAIQATLLEKSYSSTETVAAGEKMDEQLENPNEEVVEGSDGKPKETTITMAKGRGSISETRLKGVTEGSRINGLLTLPPKYQLVKPKQRQDSIIGDNNNICVLAIPNPENSVPDEKEEIVRSNMSRVILCPKEDRPLSPDRLQDTNFPPRILLEGDDK